MHYVVATDGSAESDEAVRYATRQALDSDALLEIVHVLTPRTELVEGEIVMPGGEAAVEHGQRTLERARSLAADVATDRQEELRVETELLAGRPAEAIADHAESTAADAIYVGHRGLSSEREQVVGSVAKSVVDRATVPVTIIR
ncbi:universal stress protein [Natronobeatus ordinarius]|uniref:universal stress protein n=1 Tax=Natronobeatus ordinarius TaxID=2963433 RepID=UPI0020CDF5E9|nr:universal stress protein [Natronobeatus ordinarius]